MIFRAFYFSIVHDRDFKPWLDPPCAPIECWLRVTEENLDFFEWDKNHDGIVTKKEIKEMTFIDPGTESSFNLLSDKR